MQIYSKKLIDEGVVSIDVVKKIEKDYKNNLEDKLQISKEDDNIFCSDKFINIINFYKLFKSFRKRNNYSNYIFRLPAF